jgi:hypothetical protein
MAVDRLLSSTLRWGWREPIKPGRPAEWRPNDEIDPQSSRFVGVYASVSQGGKVRRGDFVTLNQPCHTRSVVATPNGVAPRDGPAPQHDLVGPGISPFGLRCESHWDRKKTKLELDLNPPLTLRTCSVAAITIIYDST